MRINVYDTFENDSEIMKMAYQLQNEGMKSMEQPHLWQSEPITKALKSTQIMTKKVLKSF